MSHKRPPTFSLEEAVHDPGFTPRVSDVAGLLDLVAEGAESAEPAERMLLRVGPEAARQADARAADEPAAMRPRWVRLIGRIVAAQPSDELVALLVARLRDDDARSRRLAVRALGRVRTAAVEAALVAALAAESATEVRAALVEALGKVGGQQALSALDGASDSSATETTDETLGRARLRITRTLDRTEGSRFLAERSPSKPTAVVVRCRAGLDRLLLAELDANLHARLPPDSREDEGRVEATLTGPASTLLQARTMLSFGFPLPPRPIPGGLNAGPDAVASALVDALASDEAASLLRHFTEGPIRYRIDWAAGGKRRAVVWKTAQRVAAQRPELVNDPSGSTWEAAIHVAPDGGSLRVELVPRFDDARFAYRLGDVPAASHPTLAAALVRVGGVREDDVVWDPFAGSGTELCERALAGPYLRLFGTDRDAGALAVAAKNLEAAHVHAELVCADALIWQPPEPITLVVTNPPMGRRVLRGADLGAVLERMVANAARSLAPGGRMVWLSPLPKRTSAAAAAAGLETTFSVEVDMGGFHADLQAFRKPAAKP